MGNANLPNLFAASAANVPDLPVFTPDISSGDRESDYFGATVSYSFGQDWYVDLSYSRGNSTASTRLPIPTDDPSGQLPATFSIDDDWYQFYVRYDVRKLRGTRFSAYLRGGVSLVDASIDARDDLEAEPGKFFYRQSTSSFDLLGNLGFGGTLAILRGTHLRLSLQVEAEGFFGSRSLETTEQIPVFFDEARYEFDDPTVYGVLGRGTAKVEYAFGSKKLLISFLDAGIQAKYTLVDYDSVEFPTGASFSGGTSDELLWGPYVKLGLRYSF